MTITARSEFVRGFCDSCIRPTRHGGCGQVFRSILEPIRCPTELCGTHEICSYCLELYPNAWHHLERCEFAKQKVQLYAGGWSTPASTHVLRSLRRSHFPYHAPLVNLLCNLLSDLKLEDALLIPIPMSAMGRRNQWDELVRAASTGVQGIEMLSIVTRKKKHSTRRSVVQIRERIVQQEYMLDKLSAPLINQRNVILLDDNVTTGTTMIHGIELLKQYYPSKVIPLALERQISTRLLQRCPAPSLLTCPYYVRKIVPMESLDSTSN